MEKQEKKKKKKNERKMWNKVIQNNIQKIS